MTYRLQIEKLSRLKVELDPFKNGGLSTICWNSGDDGFDVELLNLRAFFPLVAIVISASDPRDEVFGVFIFYGAGILTARESPPEDDDIFKCSTNNQKV